MSLIYEIADDYLPDKNVYGIDSPDVLLAEEIVCKVLDRTIEAVKTLGSYDEETIIKVIEALKEGME